MAEEKITLQELLNKTTDELKPEDFDLSKFVFAGKTHTEIDDLKTELDKMKLKAQEVVDVICREETALRNEKDDAVNDFTKKIRAKEEEGRNWKKVVRSIATLKNEANSKFWRAKE